MSHLNNTPDVTEHPVADAPEELMKKVHRRGCPTGSRGIIREWWWLRITAAMLIPLSIWFLVEFYTNLIGGDEFTIADWLKHYGVLTAMAVFLMAGFIHARLGMHEIIIDYAHGGTKKVLTALVDLLSLVLGAASVLALIQLHMA